MINVQMNPDAFPHEFKFGDGTANRSNGMTLRDYFAAKAMAGDWASQGDSIGHVFHSDSSDAVFDASARMYYRMADAMLKARAA